MQLQVTSTARIVFIKYGKVPSKSYNITNPKILIYVTFTGKEII